MRIGEGRRARLRTPLTEHERETLVSEGLSPRYIDERAERASDYARAHRRAIASVLREWWASDKDTYAEPCEPSFETDAIFEAALERSMAMMKATLGRE